MEESKKRVLYRARSCNTATVLNGSPCRESVLFGGRKLKNGPCGPFETHIKNQSSIRCFFRPNPKAAAMPKDNSASVPGSGTLLGLQFPSAHGEAGAS